jgi:hypothetical protein|tara:strand:+ start:1072 stop:1377 length:306 start_codon:yes stop_codon:yes gene_type:complete
MLRKPDSIPAGDTVIQDPVMEPFFIAKSQSGGYTVYERVIKGDNDTEYIKTICYPAHFGGALKTVAKELLNGDPTKKVYSLKEYAAKWKTVSNSLTSVLEV